MNFYLDKEFSDEKMIKPIKVLDSFQSFIKLCDAYSNEKIEMNKINLDEAEIFNRLKQTREIVHNALCDDFNTCLAIDELSEMVAFVNRSFQSSLDPNLIKNLPELQTRSTGLNRHYGCVMSVSNYVESTLSLFGINLRSDVGCSSVRSLFIHFFCIILKWFVYF